MNRETIRSMTLAVGCSARRRQTVALLLAGGLLFAPAATASLSVSPALAQDEASQPANLSEIQVIAQGIARVPRGDLAWTIRRLDLSGTTATPVAAFPLGFLLSDGASLVVLDDAEEVLGILDDGEALFLSGGESGGLAPWRDPEASFYELALVSAEDAAGNVVGAPFAMPEGRAFELELGRGVLRNGEETIIPASRSGTPTLFLQTDGTSQLSSAAGEPVELAAGQFALLVGDVTVREGSGPGAFVVAAIGEAAPTQAADAASTGRANRANRGNRASAGAGGGGGGGGGGQGRQVRPAANQPADEGASTPEADSAVDREARRAARAAREATRAAREAENAAGAATPSPVATEEVTTPATPTPVVEQDETETEVTPEVDQIFTDDDEVAETITPEPTTAVVETPVVETPVVETPAVETPIVETPVVEEPAEPTAPPVDEAPADEGGDEGVAPPAETAPEATLPVEQIPAAEAAPVEDAPAAEAPVEQAPVDEAPAASGEEQPTTDPAAGG